MSPGRSLGCAAVDHAPSSSSQEVLLEALSAPLHLHCQPLGLILSGRREHTNINHSLERIFTLSSCPCLCTLQVTGSRNEPRFESNMIIDGTVVNGVTVILSQHQSKRGFLN